MKLCVLAYWKRKKVFGNLIMLKEFTPEFHFELQQ